MSWGQKNARFYMEVRSQRQSIEKILGSRDSGLTATMAGENGSLHIALSAMGGDDYFEVEFRPWRSSKNECAPAIIIAHGRLDYDAHRFGETMVRFDDEVLEAYRFCRAKEIMTKDIPHGAA